MNGKKKWFLIGIIIVLLIGGSLREFVFQKGSMEDDFQYKAKEFLQLYYKQYESKEEIREIFQSSEEKNHLQGDHRIDSNSNQEQKIMGFIDKNFNNILTDKAKDRLISKGLIPKMDVLDTDIIKATVKEVEFTLAERDRQGNFAFYAIIEYQYIDNSIVAFPVEGFVEILKEGGQLKVDSFELK